MEPLNTIVRALQKQFQPVKNTSAEALTHQQNLASLVGMVSILLPSVMFIFGVTKMTCFYQSLSHFYYSPIAGAVFIGCLGFIGGYLITWQGQSFWETWLATLAGPMAWLVATFPTIEAGCDTGTWTERVFTDVTYTDSSDVDPTSSAAPDMYHFFVDGAFVIHVSAALVLFAVLAFFALVVFTREIPERDRPDGGDLTEAKKTRNAIYRFCAGTIIGAIALIGIRVGLGAFLDWELAWWERYNLTFWCEAAALVAFGVSWMVKGRFWGYALVDDKVDRSARL